MTHEYVLTLEQTTSPDTGAPCLRVHVRTVRDFASFGYGIGLFAKRTGATLSVEIGGLELPRMTMQKSGPALGHVDIALPTDGAYTVTVGRKGATATFTFDIAGGQLRQPQSPLTDAFVSFEAHG
jgi:hypothetical protein